MIFFVVEDSTGDLQRIQVKTGNIRNYRKGTGFSVQFSINLNQIKAKKRPDLYYSLVPIINEKIEDFLTFERVILHKYFQDGKLGSPNKSGNINLRIIFRNNKYYFKTDDISKYLDFPLKFKKIPH